jgi:diguanylate cyclase (GGDEF)-like protein
MVLQEIAAQLTAAIRPGDAVGRYGGEEFLVILSDCGPESLRRRGEQLRQAVASGSFGGNLQGLSVSMSVGAMTIDGATVGQTPEVFLSQTDAALYRAKLEGRNRLVIADQQSLTDISLINKPEVPQEPHRLPLLS